MSIVDEFARLQGLRENGTLTEDEFAAAKAKVLVGENVLAVPNAGLERDVRRLGVQNEMLRLDQDWERERDGLMSDGLGGNRTMPSRGRNAFGVVFTSAMGLMLIVMAVYVHAFLLGFIGAAIIVLSVIAGGNGVAKADAYEQAEARYQSRRAELTDQLDRM